MFTRLSKIFTSVNDTNPSVVFVVGNFESMINILHLVPEDGSTERFGVTPTRPTFSHGGATERSREQIGNITLHVGDGETVITFLQDVEAKASKMWDGVPNKPSEQPALHTVQDVLRSAGLEAINDRDGRPRSMNATQIYPVFVVRISRTRPGPIVTEADFTSFPH